MKPRVLVFTRYYLPGISAGGPIKSVSNLISALGEEFNFHIITSDRDIGSKDKYSDIVTGSKVSVGLATVIYLKKDFYLPFKVLKIMRSGKFDLIYLNSYFDPYFSILPMLINRFTCLARLPILLAPRGEFSSGALGLKRIKKLIYLWVSKIINTYNDVIWHASTASESNDIRRLLSHSLGSDVTALVISASDIASINCSPELKKFPGSKLGSTLRLCFLSRIARMKNLFFVLEVLKDVEVPLEFSIYGPVEDLEYWKSCQDAIETLPANIHVQYFGLVPSSDVIKTIAMHDLFILPTLGENYGHVIVEAWAAGVPVLLSDQTPWRGLSGKRIGWDFPLSSPHLFHQALMTASQWSGDDWMEIKSACVKEAGKIVNNSGVIEDNRLMLRKAMGH